VLVSTERKRIGQMKNIINVFFRFNVEQLGQYLADAALDAPPPPSDTWATILNKHPRLKALPQIIPHNHEMSLIQEARHLKQKVTDVFKKTEKLLEQQFHLMGVTKVVYEQSVTSECWPRVCNFYVKTLNI